MNDFINTTIGDLGKTITGKTPSSSCASDFGDDVMFITPSDNFDNKFISNTYRKLSLDGVSKLVTKKLPSKSILVSCIGSAMGKVTMNKTVAITNQQINSIVPKSAFDPDYIYYKLKNSYKLLRNSAMGSTALPMLNKTEFDKLLLSIHTSRATQKKIASVLSAFDNKIELNSKINAELEVMAKTLYDYWFVQFDFPNADGKPYKSSGGEMVYDDVLKREIPKGWDVKKLNTLTSFLSRGISPRYADGNKGIPVLNQKCIRGHGLKYQFQRRHDNVSKSASNRLIEKYDVLVNSTGVGTLGRVALVRWLIENEVTVDSHVTIVRAIPEKINKVFFGYSLLTKQNEIEGFANGSTGQVELSRSQLSDISLLIPLANFQNKFEEFYNPIIEAVSINEKQNQELVALRDWLLPMLMNGQVTVKDAYESVEGKLGMVAERKEEYNKILK